jgi:hypothetical protein
MEVPKYFEMHKPFLEFLRDGQRHTLSVKRTLEIKAVDTDIFNDYQE